MGSSCCSASKIEETRHLSHSAHRPDARASQAAEAGEQAEDQESFLQESQRQTEENEAGDCALEEVPGPSVVIARDAWKLAPVPGLPFRELAPMGGQAPSCVNGLVNHGYSCYMNVVFQGLANTPGLREYFLRNLQLEEFPAKQAQDCLANRFAELVQVYHSYNDHVLDPSRLVDLIVLQSKVFNPRINQEDAHEFLLYLLDQLSTDLNRLQNKPADLLSKSEASTLPTRESVHKDLNPGSYKVIKLRKMSEHGTTPGSKFKFSSLVSATNSPRAIDQGKFAELDFGFSGSAQAKQPAPAAGKDREELDAMEEMSQKKWRECLESSSSIVSDALMGQMVSKLQCVKCKGASYSFEPFFMLELAIPQTQETVTLQELFAQFGRQDLLENFLWDCPKCKEKRKVLKSSHIWKFPPVLIVYLKRFESSDSGFRKNDCLVTLDLKGEDFSAFLASPRKTPLRYSPYLFIHHFGDLDQGHYTCSYFDNSDWTVIDDTSVRVLKEPDALNDASNYMIFLRLSPMLPVRNLSIEANWPYAVLAKTPVAQNAAQVEPLKNLSLGLPLGLAVYRPQNYVEHSHPVLSHNLAQLLHGNKKQLSGLKLESIKSMGEEERDETDTRMLHPGRDSRKKSTVLTVRSHSNSIHQVLGSPVSGRSPKSKPRNRDVHFHSPPADSKIKLQNLTTQDSATHPSQL